jgi:steroid 5-alpha reductase family enzyme
MTVWFLISIIKKRNDVADMAWGLGFIFIAGLLMINNNSFGFLNFLTLILVTIWGLRLAIHIFIRNRKKAEDYRYEEWRQQWGKYFYIRSYLQIFLLQGLLMLIISMPIILIMSVKNDGFNIINILGILIWFIGFLVESTADKQLADFIKNPTNKGKIMMDGLWHYSRHPNYFGEVTQWWGLFIMAVTLPFGTIGILGPLMITFLILKVSGVPLLEKKYIGNVDYEKYKKKTSVFVPWFPKK